MFNAFVNYDADDSRLDRNMMYQVCAVRDDKNGYPEFLIYASLHREWVWKSAKYFHL